MIEAQNASRRLDIEEARERRLTEQGRPWLPPRTGGNGSALEASEESADNSTRP